MMSNWFGICSRIQRNIGIVNVKNEKKHIRIIRNVNFFGKYPLSNIQKITCIILRNLFGLDLFSHQSCATGTLLLQKKIYPRKSSLNLKQLIFFHVTKKRPYDNFANVCKTAIGACDSFIMCYNSLRKRAIALRKSFLYS